jgi:hypothetical protein
MSTKHAWFRFKEHAMQKRLCNQPNNREAVHVLVSAQLRYQLRKQLRNAQKQQNKEQHDQTPESNRDTQRGT